MRFLTRFVVLSAFAGILPIFSAQAEVSGLCDCQYVACSPDDFRLYRKMCLWLGKYETVQVISVNVATPEDIAPKCKEIEATVAFHVLPNLRSDIRDGLIHRKGTVVCDELRFF